MANLTTVNGEINYRPMQKDKWLSVVERSWGGKGLSLLMQCILWEHQGSHTTLQRATGWGQE